MHSFVIPWISYLYQSFLSSLFILVNDFLCYFSFSSSISPEDLSPSGNNTAREGITSRTLVAQHVSNLALTETKILADKLQARLQRNADQEKARNLALCEKGSIPVVPPNGTAVGSVATLLVDSEATSQPLEPLPALPVMYDLVWSREGSEFNTWLNTNGSNCILPKHAYETTSIIATNVKGNRGPESEGDQGLDLFKFAQTVGVDVTTASSRVAGDRNALPTMFSPPEFRKATGQLNGGSSGSGSGNNTGKIGTSPRLRSDEGWVLNVRGTSYSITGLRPHRRYRIRLRAVGAWGHSAFGPSLLIETGSYEGGKALILGGRTNVTTYLSTAEALDLTEKNVRITYY